LLKLLISQVPFRFNADHENGIQSFLPSVQFGPEGIEAFCPSMCLSPYRYQSTYLRYQSTVINIWRIPLLFGTATHNGILPAILNITKCSMMLAWHHADSKSIPLSLPSSAINWLGLFSQNPRQNRHLFRPLWTWIWQMTLKSKKDTIALNQDFFPQCDLIFTQNLENQ